MIKSSSHPHSNTDSRLTQRELEVLVQITEELSNREIAEKLSISIRTVETHRKNIYRKIDTHSAVGITKYAINHGII